MFDFMQNLMQKIEAGKTRGYHENKPDGDKIYYITYAIKKQDNQYITYYFSIDLSKPEYFCDDDDDDGELKRFTNITEAFDFLAAKGADIKRFQAFKGSSPL